MRTFLGTDLYLSPGYKGKDKSIPSVEYTWNENNAFESLPFKSKWPFHCPRGKRPEAFESGVKGVSSASVQGVVTYFLQICSQKSF